MAQVSHVLKALQLLSLASVASLSWPPPLYSVVLLAFGQYLNFKSPEEQRCGCSIRHVSLKTAEICMICANRAWHWLGNCIGSWDLVSVSLAYSSLPGAINTGPVMYLSWLRTSCGSCGKDPSHILMFQSNY